VALLANQLWVDYCNSSLAGLPAIAFAPLQRVLNADTRYVTDLRPRDHVKLVQRSLHWLPIHQRLLCLYIITRQATPVASPN